MKIHIVEDDIFFAAAIERVIKSLGDYEVSLFYNGKEFLDNISQMPDIVTLDIGLPDYSGDHILEEIQYFNENIEVIVVSGMDDIKLAVDLLKKGAYDYISKDENILERLQNCIRNVEQKKSLKREITRLKNQIDEKYSLKSIIIGESKAVRKVVRLLNKAVLYPLVNVLINGQPGTGKEFIARAIHYNSEKSAGPFNSLNVTGLSADELRRILKGVEREHELSVVLPQGPGLFEKSEDGTLYLKEIHNLDREFQEELAEIINCRRFMRQGGTKEKELRCRIVVSTNIDLPAAVKLGEFNEKLYYRVAGLPFYLPSLKERQKDIISLSRYFLNRFCAANDLDVKTLSPGAVRKLFSYPFPGNIRELRSVIELAALLSSNGKVESDNIVFHSAGEPVDIFDEELTLKEYNKRIIFHYLNKYDNVFKVAEKLDIGKSTIYNYLKEEGRKEPGM
ncbi:sigma-54 dependent transcriptional regulator [Marinilabiliaceae bacterium ANBcel2]|nr:sigma-54 dependent transcriptional regulator [Marinilabiliaceae bacterium ANBcel2]